MKIKTSCTLCSKDFLVFPYQIRKGQGKYCSVKCGGKDRQTRVKMDCTSCGNSFFRKKWNTKRKYCSNPCRFKEYIPSNKGKKMSPEQVEKLRLVNTGRTPWNKGKKILSMTGKNHPHWIKDRTKLARYKNGNEYRNSPLSRDWSMKVKERDRWRCRLQNKSCLGKMVSHHILSWREYPELRYKLNNGITLCHAHHPRTRVKEKRLESEFQRLVSVSS